MVAVASRWSTYESRNIWFAIRLPIALHMFVLDSHYRVSAKALIYNDEGKVLLCKEARWVWDLPGGWVSHGDDILTTITRELHEELWFEVTDICDQPECCILHENSPDDLHRWVANICHRVTVKNLKFTPSDECVEIGFFSLDDIVELDTIGNVDTVFESIFLE